MRSAEIASSKSRAVTGSIVNVVRAVRSRRATSWSTPRSRACLAARSTAGSKRRRSPRSSMSASSTSAATSGRPSARSELRVPAGPGRRTHEHEVADVDARVALEHHPRRRARRTARRRGSARACRRWRRSPRGRGSAARADLRGGAWRRGASAGLRLGARSSAASPAAACARRTLAPRLAPCALPPPFVVTFADLGLPPPSASSYGGLRFAAVRPGGGSQLAGQDVERAVELLVARRLRRCRTTHVGLQALAGLRARRRRGCARWAGSTARR